MIAYGFLRNLFIQPKESMNRKYKYLKFLRFYLDQIRRFIVHNIFSFAWYIVIVLNGD